MADGHTVWGGGGGVGRVGWNRWSARRRQNRITATDRRRRAVPIGVCVWKGKGWRGASERGAEEGGDDDEGGDW
jgi:hypothetical protein